MDPIDGKACYESSSYCRKNGSNQCSMCKKNCCFDHFNQNRGMCYPCSNKPIEAEPSSKNEWMLKAFGIAAIATGIWIGLTIYLLFEIKEADAF